MSFFIDIKHKIKANKAINFIVNTASKRLTSKSPSKINEIIITSSKINRIRNTIDNPKNI